MDNLTQGHMTEAQIAAQKKQAAKERMIAFEQSECFTHFKTHLEKSADDAILRAVLKNDSNLDTKTIGFLQGLMIAKNPSKFLV